MQPIQNFRFILAATLLLCTAPAFSAGLEDENLLQTLPDGYQIGFQDRKAGAQITEMVPKAETVENWTEMLTTQVFFGLKVAPRQFKASMDEALQASCPGAESGEGVQDQENGYPILVWLQACPLNPATGKPEYTLHKAIQGNDSFYIVQKAFKYAPSEQEVTRWLKYLRGVNVCDTRLPASACPVFE